MCANHHDPAENDRAQEVGKDASWILRANPTFAVGIVATLALGIGAASSIFAVADALLLRPLPFRDADRWVEVHQSRDDNGYSMGMSQPSTGKRQLETLRSITTFAVATT